MSLKLSLAPLFLSCAASTLPRVAAAEPSSIGLTLDLEMGYFSPSTLYSQDGGSREVEGLTLKYTNLGIRKSLIDNLGLRVDVPFLQNTVGAGTPNEQRKSGMGDVSVTLDYAISGFSDHFSIDTSIRVKSTTGESKYDGILLGDGNVNIQFGLNIYTFLEPILIDFKLGYVHSIGTSNELGSNEFEPGDVLLIASRLSLISITHNLTPYTQVSHITQRDGTWSGEPLEGSGMSALTLGGGLIGDINERLSIYGQLGADLIPLGYHLPYGVVLAGEKTWGGGQIFSFGVEAFF